MSDENKPQSLSPLIPDKKHQQELGSYLLVPDITAGTVPNVGVVWLANCSWEAQKRHHSNCKSDLIAPCATSPPSPSRGRRAGALEERKRNFRDMVQDCRAPVLLGLAPHHFPSSYHFPQPMLELFLGLDGSLAIPSCKVQQDSRADRSGVCVWQAGRGEGGEHTLLQQQQDHSSPNEGKTKTWSLI